MYLLKAMAQWESVHKVICLKYNLAMVQEHITFTDEECNRFLSLILSSSVKGYLKARLIVVYLKDEWFINMSDRMCLVEEMMLL